MIQFFLGLSHLAKVNLFRTSANACAAVLVAAVTVAVSITLFTANRAMALDRDGQVGIGGGIGYAVPSFGTRFNDAAEADLHWGLWFRKHLSTPWTLGIDVVRDEFREIPGAMTAFVAGVDYRFSGDAAFSPLLGLRGGFAFFSGTNHKDRSFILIPRIGVDWHLSNALSLDALIELHHVDSTTRSDMDSGPWHSITPKVGLTYYFGAERKQETPVAATPVAPSPVATPPAAEIKLADSDNDGVHDGADKCPNTETGTAVNSFGCSVNEKASVKLEVLFESGKAKIDTSNTTSLDEFGEFLKKHSGTKAQVEGHTDSSGSRELNLRISKMRAQAVVQYLNSKHGIALDRLNAVGMGPDAPIAENKTADGRAKNRRVVAVISEK